MSEDKHISPMGGPQKGLSEEKLLAYLEGKLAPAEQHEVEQWLAEEGMESDAVDGLVALNATDRKESVNKLNRNLRSSLRPKKGRRRAAKTDVNTIAALLLILVLAIAAYLVIRYAL